MSRPIESASPQVRAFPYPTYAWLRERAPVYYSEEWDAYILSTHADVMAAFRDPRLSSVRSDNLYGSPLSETERRTLAPLLRNLAGWVLYLDPPEHTRIRPLLNSAFIRPLIESMRPRVEALVEQLLDALPKEPVIDAIAEFAAPLPLLAIAGILGFLPGESSILRHGSDALAAFLGRGKRALTHDEVAELCRAVQSMEECITDHIAARRRQPREDLITALVQAQEDGQLLSRQELLSSISVLLFAGHETTRHLIGNSLLLLAQHPEQFVALRARPALIPAAVEECLRYESPVQRIARVAAADLEIRGQRIKKGDRLYLLLGAANRNPLQFPNPESFDITRTDNRPLAFGYGVHFCIGSGLARLEAQIALSSWLRRFPTMRCLKEQPDWVSSLTLRGPAVRGKSGCGSHSRRRPCSRTVVRSARAPSSLGLLAHFCHGLLDSLRLQMGS